VAWFRRTVEVPDDWGQRPLVLELGPIDDWDVTYFNGRRIGAHDSGYAWQTERRYDVPASVVRAGRNVLTVRVIDTGGAGGIYGSADQLKLYQAGGGEGEDSEAIGLAGPWRYAIGAPMRDLPPSPRKKTFHAGSPAALYNGMIAPLLPYAMRGAIWYQGESNRYDPAGYRTLFPAMIRCWRDAWGCGDFPFYFVQIAPFDYTLHGQKPDDSTARLREAQLMTLDVPYTGMAVTMDVGNRRDIHPRDKRPVGERLARWAKAKIYGRDDLVFSGPLYRSMKVEGDRIRLSFDFIGSGLVARGGELTHFTIAGEDGVFVPARAMIDGPTVIVFSEQVRKPTAVRYAWSDAPDPNLFNREGLPASPFRTDVGRD
jgi:sialate O-acetylesterase